MHTHTHTQSEPGPDFCVGERDLEVLLKILVDLRVSKPTHTRSLSQLHLSLFSTQTFFPPHQQPTVDQDFLLQETSIHADL